MAGSVMTTRRAALLGLCLGVGVLAAVILTAAIPIGMAAVLLAPLLALAPLVALPGAWAAGRRRAGRTGARGDAHSHTR
jgi:Flp pilus assembly protein TadB